MNCIEIEIRKNRNKFYIFAGRSKLSNGYKTEFEAEKELEQNISLYRYWSGSISVSVENTEHKIIEVKK